MPSYEAKIIEVLKKSDRSLSTLELVKKSGLSKSTVIKYLATFRMTGKADFEEIGSSRLWRLLTPVAKKERMETEVSKSNQLDEVLQEFVESTELTGFAVVDPEGLPLSAVLPKNIVPERLGALASLLFKVGIKTIELADFEEFERIVVEGSKGRILACKEAKVLLIAFSKPDSTLGALRTEMATLAKKINEILSTEKDSEE